MEPVGTYLHDSERWQCRIYKCNINRTILVLSIVAKKDIKTEDAALIFQTAKSFLERCDTRMYFHIDMRNIEMFSLSLLEYIASTLNSMKPLMKERLMSTLLEMSDDTYWGKSVMSTLKDVFFKLYTPVRPIDFCLKPNDIRENICSNEKKYSFKIGT